MKENFSFEKLVAYQEARQLVVETYGIIRLLPKEETFAIGSQLRRSILSVPSNIAEGSGRKSLKEKIHFLEIAYGSLMEAYCQIEVCKDLGYIAQETLNGIRPRFFKVSYLINALSNSFSKKTQ